ncbi:UrcA family protein [Hyphomonas sp.]|jgi:UrcA family protein|uniref:UrcA family protein n=2 Tax=Hyphomonas sp. TaxID=87 RepID=UPI003000FCE5|tara:strand:- start:1378 stop:1683 length:306 start_codon:yes stop_codon:yes gene_type:complete
MIRSLTAIALAASIATAPAFAASDDFKMEIDLNRTQLSTTEGAKAEYDRIRQDVHTRCAVEHENFGVAKNFVVNQCESKMMKKIVAYVDDATFTKVHYASN